MVGTTRVESQPRPNAAALAAVAPADSTRQVPIAVLVIRIPKLAGSNAAFDEAGQFAAATPRRLGEWFTEHTDEEKH